MFFFFFFSSIASNAEEARGRGLDNDSLAIYLITGLKKKQNKKNNGADAVRRFFSYGSPHYFSFFVQRVFFTGFVLLFCFFFNTRLDRFVMEVAGVYRFFFCCYWKEKKKKWLPLPFTIGSQVFRFVFLLFFSLFVRVAFPNCLFLPYADNEKCLFSFSFSACFFFFCWKTVTSQLLQKKTTKNKKQKQNALSKRPGRARPNRVQPWFAKTKKKTQKNSVKLGKKPEGPTCGDNGRPIACSATIRCGSKPESQTPAKKKTKKKPTGQPINDRLEWPAPKRKKQKNKNKNKRQ